MKQIVTFIDSKGHHAIGRLVKMNQKTAIVKRHKWIKSPAIKLHIKKNHVKITGDLI